MKSSAALVVRVFIPILLILLSYARTATSSTTITPTTSTVSCNGHPEFCNRTYSNVTLIGSHDSVFVGPLPQQNQNIPIPAQLDMGIRFLQAQTHRSEEDASILELCHTSCLLEDAGSLESFLTTVKTWLDNHPTEVVTLLLTNGDNVPVSEFDAAFASSGIKPYAYVPAQNPLPVTAWPTLQELITNKTRLVVFLDYGANPSIANYILDEFVYFFETPYDVTNPNFPDCSINRPPGLTPATAIATGRMYIVNHFLDVDIFGIKIPNRLEAGRTNAATGTGSIGAQSELCESIYHRVPNVVLVDFVDQGQVIQAQNMLNGV